MTFSHPPAPGAIRLDSQLSIPEKAALSSTSTVHVPNADRFGYSSVASTPRSDRRCDPFDTDIEAMATNTSTDKVCRKSLVLTSSECQVWPNKDHWKKQAKQAKVKRSTTSWMAKLSARNKIIVKVLMILLIVGIAVGVGFGVSKPLGAPIWGKKNE